MSSTTGNSGRLFGATGTGAPLYTSGRALSDAVSEPAMLASFFSPSFCLRLRLRLLQKTRMLAIDTTPKAAIPMARPTFPPLGKPPELPAFSASLAGCELDEAVDVTWPWATVAELEVAELEVAELEVAELVGEDVLGLVSRDIKLCCLVFIQVRLMR
jgi:hypothetical protein